MSQLGNITFEIGPDIFGRNLTPTETKGLMALCERPMTIILARVAQIVFSDPEREWQDILKEAADEVARREEADAFFADTPTVPPGLILPN